MNHSIETFSNLSQEKQERIVDAATDEFAEHGYQQASMNRLVKSIGIAKGSLFKYFGSKQGVFEYLFEHAISQLKPALKKARDEKSSNDFFLQIEESLLTAARFIEKHPRIYHIYLKSLFHTNMPLRHKLLTEVRSASHSYLHKLVLRGIKSKQLRADLDIESTVFILDATLDRFLQSWLVVDLSTHTDLYQADHDSLRIKAHALTQTLRSGFSASTPE